MPTVQIDNVEYDTDSLPDGALENLNSIQFVDAEIARLQAKLAAMNTARMAYGAAVQELLAAASDATDES